MWPKFWFTCKILSFHWCMHMPICFLYSLLPFPMYSSLNFSRFLFTFDDLLFYSAFNVCVYCISFVFSLSLSSIEYFCTLAYSNMPFHCCRCYHTIVTWYATINTIHTNIFHILCVLGFCLSFTRTFPSRNLCVAFDDLQKRKLV